MKKIIIVFVCTSCITRIIAQNNSTAIPAAAPANFQSGIKNINGSTIHYVKGGSGEPLLLLHGFGENWYMWNRLLPELSKQFTVIAADLPGMGESGKPDSGYDKNTMASTIHSLINLLGYKKIFIAGHDIGLMVAFAYAAQYRDEVNKLALLDAVLPGIEPMWSESITKKWWFGFFARPVAPELIKGNEEIFFTDFWLMAIHIPNSFTAKEKSEFIRAYSTQRSLYGAFQWFKTFDQDIKDNIEFAKNKLQMPVLTIAGEFAAAKFLGPQLKLIATNVKEVIIKNAGHWIVQEQPGDVLHVLIDFFHTL